MRFLQIKKLRSFNEKNKGEITMFLGNRIFFKHRPVSPLYPYKVNDIWLHAKENRRNYCVISEIFKEQPTGYRQTTDQQSRVDTMDPSQGKLGIPKSQTFISKKILFRNQHWLIYSMSSSRFRIFLPHLPKLIYNNDKEIHKPGMIFQLHIDSRLNVIFTKGTQ